MLSSPPIHREGILTPLLELHVSHLYWSTSGGHVSFYYWECHLRQEKTLIIGPMAPIKGIKIELEAKVITLWLVNCHPLRLSYTSSPQELEARQPTPRTVNEPNNKRLETLGHTSSTWNTGPSTHLMHEIRECPRYEETATPHHNYSCCFVLCVCCCHVAVAL